MTVVYLSPSTSVHNDGAVTGAGTWPAQIADASDATYVVLTASQYFEVNLSDLSLPTDAELVYAQGYIKCAKASGFFSALMQATIDDGDVYSESTNVTWVTAALAYLPTIGFPTDAELDAATLAVGNFYSSAAALTVYRALVKVFYIIKPVVTAVYPTGTLTEDNTPTALWTVAYDPDWTEPAELRYEVKIYDDTTYTLGSVDPDVDTPYLEGSGTTDYEPVYGHDFPNDVLPNDNYRMFIRTSYYNDQWSDWDFEDFTINVTPPSVPDLVVTAEEGQGRLRVRINDNASSPTSDYFQLQRSLDGGGSWEYVRTTEGDGKISDTGDGYVYYWDTEVPIGGTATYRARAAHIYSGGIGASAWSDTEFGSWSSEYAWIKSVTDPFNYALQVNVREYGSRDQLANQGVFRPLGARLPVIVDDARSGETGSITVRCDSREERDALDAVLAAGGTYLIQVPTEWEIPDRFVNFGDAASTRLVNSKVLAYSDEQLNWTRVDEPTDDRVED